MVLVKINFKDICRYLLVVSFKKALLFSIDYIIKLIKYIFLKDCALNFDLQAQLSILFSLGFAFKQFFKFGFLYFGKHLFWIRLINFDSIGHLIKSRLLFQLIKFFYHILVLFCCFTYGFGLSLIFLNWFIHLLIFINQKRIYFIV